MAMYHFLYNMFLLFIYLYRIFLICFISILLRIFTEGILMCNSFLCVCVCISHSIKFDSVTPWTVSHQAHLVL